MTRLYRIGISLETKVKELSAHTLASFMVAQGVDSVPALCANRPMNMAALRFINRDSATNHWKRTGWLEESDGALLLTEEGQRQCVERETGEARDAAGRRKKECVPAQLIQQMRAAILFGRYSDASVTFEHREFDLD